MSFGEAVSFAAFAGSLVGKTLSERQRKATLKKLVAVWVYEHVPAGANARARIVESLDRQTSVMDDLYAAVTADDYEDVLRRLGVLRSGASEEAEGQLVGALVDLRYSCEANPTDHILRDDVRQGRQGIEAIQTSVGRIEEYVRKAEPTIPHREINLNLVAHQVGVPLLAPWSPRLKEAFSPINRDFATFLKKVPEERERSPEQAVEDLVLLAAYGDPKQALERLLALPAESFEDGRAVTRLRLIGTLQLELDELDSAKKSFRRARSKAEGLPSGAEREWLRRRTKLDENLFVDDWEARAENHKEMLDVPAWHSLPMADDALVDMLKNLTNEAYALLQDRPGGFRSSDNVYRAWVSRFEALTLAYLSGDWHVVRVVKRAFAYAALPVVAQGHDQGEALLNDVVRDLLSAEVGSDIKPVLEAYGHKVADKFPWDELAFHYRPEKQGSQESIEALSMLTIIEAMAPYLSDASRQRLTEEFVGRAETYGRNQGDPLIRNEYYAESYFIDAFAKVTFMNNAQLERLAGVLAAHEPNHSYNLWKVLNRHQWDQEQLASGRRVLKAARATEPNNQGIFLYSITDALRGLQEGLPQLADEVSVLFLEWAQRYPEAEVWLYLLDRHYAPAAAFVRERYEKLVDGTVNEFRGAREEHRT